MRRSLLLCCLLGACLLLGRPAYGQEDVADEDDEYADSLQALLVVHKQCLGPTGTSSGPSAYPVVVQGKNVTVEAILYNGGTSTAMDVTYEDVLPKNAELVEGSLQASFPRIAMGSSARHSYVVRFTSGRGKQVMFLPQASVAYVSDTESTTQTGRSSKAGIFVLTPLQQLQEWAVTVGRYATFTLVRTAEDWTKLGIFVGVVGGLLGVNWLVKQISSTRSSSQRRKALQQLEKEGK
mmetsp:Transcript_8076/g.21493  ORF Transcript_8076/g.21493 Transcript_8076/m.21493 type:complete len:237 (+) Transcript_8076:39-749(+)